MTFWTAFFSCARFYPKESDFAHPWLIGASNFLAIPTSVCVRRTPCGKPQTHYFYRSEVRPFAQVALYGLIEAFYAFVHLWWPCLVCVGVQLSGHLRRKTEHGSTWCRDLTHPSTVANESYMHRLSYGRIELHIDPPRRLPSTYCCKFKTAAHKTQK